MIGARVVEATDDDGPTPRTGGPARRGRYHHGDLAGALVDAGVALLGESGPSAFSVAELARRVGVSTAAPYRHFADRDRLLAAVVTRIATELAGALAAAVDDAGSDPVDQLAAAAGAYVDVVRARRVGMDVIFSPALRAVRDEDLAAAGRALMGVLLGPALALAGDGEGTLRLLERVLVLAHGYATLDADHFLTSDRVTTEPTAARARAAAAALLRGTAGP